MRQRSSQSRHRASRRVSVSVALVVGVVLVLVGVVQAALPPKGQTFEFADHATSGKNWHVDFQVDAKSRKKLKTLIVYSEQCDATVVKRDVPISGAGVIAVAGGVPDGGTFTVNATFTATRKLVGTMRMIRTGCDTGLLNYPTAITGDGTGEHVHTARYPDFASATHKQRRQARALQVRVLKYWHGISVTDAKHLGYFRETRFQVTDGIFHVYNHTYEKDHRIFDARRPESLVFWRPPKGAPQILGPMFRVPPGKRPSFAGPIPIYHHHESQTGRIVSAMTHVWMVNGPKSAWAFCLPVKQLELYNPTFKWLPGYSNHEHIGAPC